jgi:hypothetical protein
LSPPRAARKIELLWMLSTGRSPRTAAPSRRIYALPKSTITLPISHDEPAAQTEPPARHKGPTPSARKRYTSKGGSKTPKPSVGFEQQARSEPASSTSVTSEASC